jgi:glycosyltransferase involved in cell wall biosynthesis
MRVLIVNTSEKTGGAAVAAGRLMEALNNNGVKAKMLVRDRAVADSLQDKTISDRLTVVGLGNNWRRQWPFLWERLVVFFHLHFSRKHLFDIDIANAGIDITKLPEFREADVIHLHWINQGMLSLSGIRRILQSGKPVVWTMHDIWPATAICHLTLDCHRHKNQCAHCWYLPGGGSQNDLAAKVWQKKKALLDGGSISFVACSRWLASEAKQSALLAGQEITSIPNPISTRLFHPVSRDEARQQLGLPVNGRLLLFVSQRVTNRYKGMDYLAKACQKLARLYPDMVADTGVIILGGHAEEVAHLLPFKTYPIGYVNDEHQIVKVYNAADAFVLPSLSENLPNTIMEAMACGVPCIGFKVGGIPEEIDHRKNGYVAAYRDAVDLARGLHWVLCEADHEALSQAALSKVHRCYTCQSVALKYTEIYNEALARQHYKI